MVVVSTCQPSFLLSFPSSVTLSSLLSHSSQLAPAATFPPRASPARSAGRAGPRRSSSSPSWRRYPVSECELARSTGDGPRRRSYGLRVAHGGAAGVATEQEDSSGLVRWRRSGCCHWECVGGEWGCGGAGACAGVGGEDEGPRTGVAVA